MPTLDWRNRDEATKTAARVLVRALIEIPELGCTSLAEAQSRGEKCCQCDNVASANFQFYARNIDTVQIHQVQVDEVPDHYNKCTPKGRRYYLKPLRAMGKNDGREDRPNLFYPMVAPDGTEVFPVRADGSDGNWRWSRTKVNENPNLIEWVSGRSGWTPYYRFFADEHSSRPPETLWGFSFAGSNRIAKAEQTSLFGTENAFTTPKPELLLKRILEIATNPGDLVLDSFLGSGTTAAVAHKMGRRWIGVELGDHARTHCAVRLRKVVEGEQGGISKAVGWTGGGSFRFLELGEEIFDAGGAVRAEVPWEVLAAHVWFTETKTGWNVAHVANVANSNSQLPIRSQSPSHSPLPVNPHGPLETGNNGTGNTSTLATLTRSPVLGIHEGVAYALLYNGILHDRRVDGGNVLTRRTLALIREDLARLFPEETPKRLMVFAEWSRLGQETLAAERIEFRQTPYDLKGGR